MVISVSVATCRLDKLLSGPSAATLCQVSGTLIIRAADGSNAVQSAPVNVQNCGDGDLGWKGSTQSSSPWLSLRPDSGTTTPKGTQVLVQADPKGMSSGIYSDVVLIDGTNISTHLAVPVQFIIHGCDTTGLIVNVPKSDALNGADCATPHGPRGTFGQVFSFSGTQNEVISVYLTGSFNGYIALDTNLTKAPLAQATNCVGGTPGNPCIQYVSLPAPGLYLVEVTGQTSGDTGSFNIIVADPRNPNDPTTLDQRLDATRSIPVGNTIGQDTVFLQAVVSDPDLGDSLHLVAEVDTIGQTFTGGANAFGIDTVPNGDTAHIVVTGLKNHTGYHWRVRAIDQTSHQSLNWVSFGNNPETTPDFVVSISQPPATVSNLSQFQANDSVTSIGIGGIVPTDTIVLAGQVSDPDPGDVVRLMVEVKPVGTTFNGIATDSSAPYPGSGSIAKVRVGPLPNNTNYHWQAWAEDQTGRVSSPKPFGGNPEIATDFRIQVAHPPDLPSGLGQFQTDLTPIVVGGTANQGSVVFQGIVSDTDGGTVSLHVEVEPIGTNFTDSASGTSNPVASGQVASLSLSSPTIQNGQCYHWQAQALDNTNRTSGWSSFGGNPEIASDFCVALPVSQIVFTVNPQPSIQAGTNMSPAIQVTARNSLGQTVTSFTGAVTISLNNPGSATLGGTRTVNASAGVATFSDLSVNKIGSGYSLQASAAGFNATSTTFSVTPGPVTQLAFTVQPTPAAANATITPAVQVSAWDADSNLVNTFTGQVTLSITPGSGTAGAVLSNPGPVAAVAGTATFSNLSINLSGANYTLKAVSGALTQPTSTPFSITGGPIASLVFNVQPPLNTTAGAAMVPAVQVTAKDASGNVANFNGLITLALSPNGFGGILSGNPSVNASGGVAVFTNLRVRQFGTSYTMTASATGAPPITSNAFNINAGTATQLHFTTQPTSTADSAIIDSTVNGVVVTAFDSTGLNVATTFTGTVRINITPGTGTAGAGLFGSSSQAAVAGVARFTNLRINKLGTAYQLTATVSGGVPSSDDSQPFDIVVGPAKALVFTAEPPAQTVANVAMNPAVQVTARDAAGNTVTAFNSQVTLTITSGTGTAGAVLSGGVVNASVGIATYSSLSIDKAGPGYTLTATSSGLTQDVSTSFTILAGGPDAGKSSVTPNPSSITACKVGCTFPSTLDTIAVIVRDAASNPISGATVTLASSSPSANLTQPVGVTNALGRITGTVSDTNAGPQQITATVIGTPNVGITQQATVTVNAAAAVAVQFTRSPNATVAGTIINPVNGVQVQVNDQFNNKVTTASTSITLAILVPPSPAGGVLNGTTMKSAVSGLATFSDLRIKQANTNYVLGASSVLPIQDSSTQFNITPAPASKLVFVQQPTSTTGGATMAPVTVQIQDSVGNVINSNANVTVAITSGTGTAGAHLLGTVTVAASAGTATFSTLGVDSAGANYTLTSTSSGLTSAISTPFTISVGSPSRLVYGQPPTNAQAGASIAPAVTVRILDAGGNLTTSTANVQLAITSGTGTVGAHLSGGASVTVGATNGTATFNSLSIDSVGTNYTLSATSAGLAGATSGPFNISGGPPTQLKFGVQPTPTTGGATISPAVTVRILDAGGNQTSSTANVTLAITGGTGTTGAHLSGGTTVTVGAVNGTATFNTLNIDSAGTNYTLSATSGILTGATSNPFTVTVGAASRLTFGVQPSNENSETAIAPAVTVRLLDAGGNQTASGATVIVSITNGTGTSGAHLLGTVSVGAVSGTATFSTLNIDSAGTGYTLSAASGSLSGATSSPFNIAVGPATKLGFRVQPGNSTGGVAISSFQVEVRDAGGNRVTTASTSIQLSFGTKPDPAASLLGTNPVSAINGLATFSTIAVDSAANGYTLLANGGGFTQATSSPFNITIGPAAQIAFHTQPSTTVAGQTITPNVQVEIEDAGGNRVNTNSQITVAIGNNAGGGTLSGTLTKNAVSGLATFNNLSINKTGIGYTLGATLNAFTATSTGFDITPAAAHHLVFTVEPPASTAANVAMSPSVVVEIHDQFDNLVNSNDVVTLSFGTDPSSGVAILGGNTATATGGVATFSNLTIDTPNSGYTLVASDGALGTDTSTPFTITP